jgi:hypothetical protein
VLFWASKSVEKWLENNPKNSVKNQAKNAQKCAKWPKQRANALGLTV